MSFAFFLPVGKISVSDIFRETAIKILRWKNEVISFLRRPSLKDIVENSVALDKMLILGSISHPAVLFWTISHPAVLFWTISHPAVLFWTISHPAVLFWLFFFFSHSKKKFLNQ